MFNRFLHLNEHPERNFLCFVRQTPVSADKNCANFLLNVPFFKKNSDEIEKFSNKSCLSKLILLHMIHFQEVIFLP